MPVLARFYGIVISRIIWETQEFKQLPPLE